MLMLLTSCSTYLAVVFARTDAEIRNGRNARFLAGFCGSL